MGLKICSNGRFLPPEIFGVAEISAAIFRDVDFLGSKTEKIGFFQTLRGHIIVANDYFSKRLKPAGDPHGIPIWPKKFWPEIFTSARNFWQKFKKKFFVCFQGVWFSPEISAEFSKFFQIWKLSTFVVFIFRSHKKILKNHKMALIWNFF